MWEPQVIEIKSNTLLWFRQQLVSVCGFNSDPLSVDGFLYSYVFQFFLLFVINDNYTLVDQIQTMEQYYRTLIQSIFYFLINYFFLNQIWTIFFYFCMALAKHTLISNQRSCNFEEIVQSKGSISSLNSCTITKFMLILLRPCSINQYRYGLID